MMTYQLIKDKYSDSVAIKKTDDNGMQTIIPMADDNTDYQAYLKWVAEGNTPLPAEEA
jgi:hypothetical protein